MRRITHGEAYVLKRENINFKNSFLQIEKNLRKIPKPMPL